MRQSIGVLLLLIFSISLQAQVKKTKNKKSSTEGTADMPSGVGSGGGTGEVMEDVYMIDRSENVSSDCKGCSENLQLTYASKNGNYKYGYYNGHGQEVIPYVYDDATDFADGSAVVGIGGKYGIIDLHGEFILPMKYTYLRRAHYGGYYIAAINNRYGIIDAKGKVILPLEYEQIESESDLLYGVYKGGKEGLYDLAAGKWILEFKYKRINVHNQYIFASVSDDRMDWIRRSDLKLIDTTYQSVSEYRSGVYIVKRKGLEGLVDSDNNQIIPITYKSLDPIYGTRIIIANKNDKYGLITFDNRVLLDFVYDDIRRKDELYLVRRNGYYGVVDELAGFKETVPCEYEYLSYASSQRIFAKKKGGLFGIIRYDNTVVEDFVYELSFRSGYIEGLIYKKKGKYGLMDNYGLNFLTEPVYDKIEEVTSSRYGDRKYLGYKGKELTMFSYRGTILFTTSAYDALQVTNTESMYIAIKGDKYGLIDGNQQELLPCSYDLIAIDETNRIFALEKGVYREITFVNGQVTMAPVK